MDIRQEQVVLIGAALVIGAFVYTNDVRSAQKLPRSKRIELVPHVVPDANRVLPASLGMGFERDILTEPTNSRPMPLLAFDPPPVAGLTSLAAPSVPGLRPSDYGAFLRQTVVPASVPDLFDTSATSAQVQELGSGAVGDTLSQLRDLGFVPGAEELIDTTPDRAALIETYKSLYDWILLDQFDYHFGRIDNGERYRLIDRLEEDVALSEVDPVTGQPKMASMGSVDYLRGRVTSFGFAFTTTNIVDMGAIEREGPMTRGNTSERLEFADWCVARRHEAPRALDVAGDLYTRIAAFDAEDPAPRLGLASCLEAGFKFEEAFAEYGTLSVRFPRSAAVAAAMAGLEERFLMIDGAQARLEDAVRFEPSSFAGQHALGTFQLRNGATDADFAAAVTALGAAERRVPDTADAASVRSNVRADLGAAHLALGALAEARKAFESALAADSRNQRGHAGLMTCDRLEGNFQEADWSEEGIALGAEFLLSRGLTRIESRDWTGARDDLLGAVAANPLTSELALRALSRLAELTGNDEEAMQFIESALIVDPRDVWARYQLGRLLLAQDDVAGAEQALNAALQADVNFVDVLALLGEIAMDKGEYGAAERYFDRVLRLEEPRASIEVRRGLNALFRSDAAAARDRFEGARTVADDDPVAIAGIAWCEYLEDQSKEGSDRAINRLAGLDDSRRSFGEQDPWRLWAQVQKERIEKHLLKSRWVDEFDRQDVRNSWMVDEGAGPIVGLEDEQLSIVGQFQGNGSVRVFMAKPAATFVSFSADFTVSGDSAARAGLFIAREQGTKTNRTISSQVRVLRHKDGSLQTHVVRSGRPDDGASDVSWLDFPADTQMRLRIERSGSDTAATVNIYVDGTPVLEGVSMTSIGKSTALLSMGFFAEGESGRRIDMRVDNVELVLRGQ